MSRRTSAVQELTHKTEKEISLSLSLKAMDHVAAVRGKIQRNDTAKQKAAALGRAKSAPQHRSWAHLYQPRVPGGCPTTGSTAAELQPYLCWQTELQERLCCTQTAGHQAAASSEITDCWAPEGCSCPQREVNSPNNCTQLWSHPSLWSSWLH